jgi:glycosyltransferase involved in cell wall biosynthesis
MIKILYITVRADYGGGPEHLFRLLQHLPQNIEPWVACPRELPYWNRYVGLIGETRMSEIPHRKFQLSHLFALRKILIKNGIDIIHSHGKGAGVYGRFLALMTGKPCIHTFHGIHLGEYGPIKKILYLVLECFFSKLTRNIIAVSSGEANKLKTYKLCNHQKIIVIENGVVIPSETVDNNLLGKYQVVSITRFDYAKNSELIIPILLALKANHQIDRFSFIILGIGEDRKKLEAQIEKQGLSSHVSFCGFVENPNEYLKKSFCYLSTSRWEGMPLAVLEAMAVGLPVIASNVVGNKDVVDNGVNGYLYDLDSPESAARSLIQLADDLEQWTQFSKAARDKISSHFGIEQMSAKTAKLYYHLIK